jgi:DNA-directed RNA polymerase specialized sigma24 family protein
MITNLSGDLDTLMSRARRGDLKAYERLLTLCSQVAVDRVERDIALRGMATEEAEACVQEILRTVHDKRQTWSPKVPFATWLSAVMDNKIDRLRRQRGDPRREQR